MWGSCTWDQTVLGRLPVPHVTVEVERNRLLPMHACEVAQQMEMRTVLVPPGAGVFSSLGLLLAEPLHDFVRTMLGPVDKASSSRLNQEFRLMEKKGAKLLTKEEVDPKDRMFA